MILENTQKGFGMVEALVATVVLSIGLLGLATLQTQGLRNNNSAYFRTQANMLAASMLDYMRANPPAARAGDFDILMSETPSGTTAVKKNLVGWINRIGEALPSGDGAISCDKDSCVVAIRWDDSLAMGDSSVGLLDYDANGIADNIADKEANVPDRAILVLRTRI